MVNVDVAAAPPYQRVQRVLDRRVEDAEHRFSKVFGAPPVVDEVVVDQQLGLVV